MDGGVMAMPMASGPRTFMFRAPGDHGSRPAFNPNIPPPVMKGPPPNVATSPTQRQQTPGGGSASAASAVDVQNALFDGKRMRKAVHRKTVDYNSTVVEYLENRIWQRDFRDVRAVQPDTMYCRDLVPPPAMLYNPTNCVTSKFIRQSTNKFRCPIFAVAWTPEGRRLVTGASSGEFTLWNGLTFNFETILQAHDTSVRSMQWSHNDLWMVTADHAGFIKYWQTNMNNVKMYQGHKEAIRGISFCPTDSKFASCSDDGTVRVWDFSRCHEERILRGHGSDVKCVDWHPQKSLIASGSRDNQQPIKLWDPKSGTSLATIHAHKMTVMDLQWNQNGNWMLTASRDHLLKLFDIRNMKEEIQSFKGHKKEATAVKWHPIHESLFASGGSDGGILFWNVGTDREVGGMEEAHDGMVWTLAWHPLGHILASGSNDHSTKFWTRNRPGDQMRDKYNLNTMTIGEQEMLDYDLEPQNAPSLPGMGQIELQQQALEKAKREREEEAKKKEEEKKKEEKRKLEEAETLPVIPGLDFTEEVPQDKNESEEKRVAGKRKAPYQRPVPKSFEAAWAEAKPPDEEGEVHDPDVTPLMSLNIDEMKKIEEKLKARGIDITGDDMSKLSWEEQMQAVVDRQSGKQNKRERERERQIESRRRIGPGGRNRGNPNLPLSDEEKARMLELGILDNPERPISNKERNRLRQELIKLEEEALWLPDDSEEAEEGPSNPQQPPGQAPPGQAPTAGQTQKQITPGQQIPPGHQFPPGQQIPPGQQMPPGHQMLPGSQIPPGQQTTSGHQITQQQIPPGQQIPQGQQLPPGHIQSGQQVAPGQQIPPHGHQIPPSHQGLQPGQPSHQGPPQSQYGGPQNQQGPTHGPPQGQGPPRGQGPSQVQFGGPAMDQRGPPQRQYGEQNRQRSQGGVPQGQYGDPNRAGPQQGQFSDPNHRVPPQGTPQGQYGGSMPSRQGPQQGQEPPKNYSQGPQDQYSEQRPEQGEYSEKRPHQGEYSEKRPQQGEYSEKRPQQGEYSEKKPPQSQYSEQRPQQGQYGEQRTPQDQYNTSRQPRQGPPNNQNQVRPDQYQSTSSGRPMESANQNTYSTHQQNRNERQRPDGDLRGQVIDQDFRRDTDMRGSDTNVRNSRRDQGRQDGTSSNTPNSAQSAMRGQARYSQQSASESASNSSAHNMDHRDPHSDYDVGRGQDYGEYGIRNQGPGQQGRGRNPQYGDRSDYGEQGEAELGNKRSWNTGPGRPMDQGGPSMDEPRGSKFSRSEPQSNYNSSGMNDNITGANGSQRGRGRGDYRGRGSGRGGRH